MTGVRLGTTAGFGPSTGYDTLLTPERTFKMIGVCDPRSNSLPARSRNAGEKAAQLLFAASGSKTVAEGGESERRDAEVVDFLAPPAGVEPTTYRLGGGRSIH